MLISILCQYVLSINLSLPRKSISWRGDLWSWKGALTCCYLLFLCLLAHQNILILFTYPLWPLFSFLTSAPACHLLYDWVARNAFFAEEFHVELWRDTFEVSMCVYGYLVISRCVPELGFCHTNHSIFLHLLLKHSDIHLFLLLYD